MLEGEEPWVCLPDERLDIHSNDPELHDLFWHTDGTPDTNAAVYVWIASCTATPTQAPVGNVTAVDR